MFDVNFYYRLVEGTLSENLMACSSGGLLLDTDCYFMDMSNSVSFVESAVTALV